MKVKELRQELKLTQQQIADSLDIERSLYAKIEAGKNNLTVDQIKKVIKIHNVNPDWILFGEGGMFKSNIIYDTDDSNDIYTKVYNSLQQNKFPKDTSLNNTITESETAYKTADETADKSAELPKTINKPLNTDINLSKKEIIHILENQGLTGRKVYISPEPAMASNPFAYASDESEEEGLSFFWMPFLRKTGFYAAFRVDGQSMQGCIENGSWVVCRLLDDASQVRGGNIHLIATKSEGLVLKRIETSIPNTIICYSDNHIYSPFILPSEEVVKVWAVESCLEQSFYFNSEKATLKLENFIENLSKR